MNSDRTQLGPIQAKIVAAFDAAAGTYDSVTPVQREVSRALVARAAAAMDRPPKQILDLGAGAGHVTEEIRRYWPEAKITALDAAPAMLARLQTKFPQVATICADAQKLENLGAYDLILSSMMAHWLPDPAAALADWRNHLAPGGQMLVALPVASSLSEWRDLLASAGLSDGLWAFPDDKFATALGASRDIMDFPATYSDARDFVRSLKAAGAHRSRPGRQPTPPAALRRVLALQHGPFTATFRIAFMALRAPT